MVKATAVRCGGKRRHDERASAARYLDFLIDGGASRSALWVYRCDGLQGCGGWHVGPTPHLFADNPDAPGTCRHCACSDNPEAPVNERHDPAKVAAYEAAEEEKRQARLERDRIRMGER